MEVELELVCVSRWSWCGQLLLPSIVSWGKQVWNSSLSQARVPNL